MGSVGKVGIAQKAPYFECEAIVSGTVQDVSLSTYIRPSIKPSTPDPDAPWLIIMFIPAAFSFVCPTEVLAFQNCLEEFKDRNCNVVFVSVDTKHVLWHWQNVPRQFGGLGHIDIPLLSDANHRIAQDYGVLIEDEGISLRGMFILDGEGVVQQITLNNITVGRSVLEALRLLEAFQAVAKHGVLCPVDWKPTPSDQTNVEDTISAIHNTLTESYEERLANLQKEFGDIQVTDLDAVHKKTSDDGKHLSASGRGSGGIGTAANTPLPTPRPSRSQSNASVAPTIQEVVCQRVDAHSPKTLSNTPRECALHVPHGKAPAVTETPSSPPELRRENSSKTSFHSTRSSSIPPPDSEDSSLNTLPPPEKRSTSQSTARHARGHSSGPSTPRSRATSGSGTALPQPQHLSTTTAAAKHQTYESRRGSHVVLEFADPTSSPGGGGTNSPSLSYISNPFHTSGGVIDHHHHRTTPRPGTARSHSYTQRAPHISRTPTPTPTPAPGHMYRAASQPAVPTRNGRLKPAGSDPSTGASSPSSSSMGPTRLQATFQVIRNMGAGLTTPRVGRGEGNGNGSKEELGMGGGYFDVEGDVQV